VELGGLFAADESRAAGAGGGLQLGCRKTGRAVRAEGRRAAAGKCDNAYKGDWPT
jgi:hypothetical protein